jgi:transposase
MNGHISRDNVQCSHWIGADVSKVSFDVGLVACDQHYPDTALREIPTNSFERSREGVEAFLDWLGAKGVDAEKVRVVMEATGNYSTELAVWMLCACPSLSPAIVNPHHTAAFIRSMAVRNKTDRLEARALGFYGVERLPRPYEPLSPEHAELRSLSRHRDQLVRQQTMMKNQMQEAGACPFVRKNRKKRLRLINNDIARVEKEMKALVGQDEKLRRDVELLTSIYGVAFINATTILAELGDLRRFSLARQLTAFAGMSPRHRDSGSSVHGRSRLCKQGNPRVRQCLYLSAMTAIRANNQFRRMYQRLRDEGKAPMVALGAIMRKLLVLMRAILINGQPYRPLGITRQ